MWVRAMNTSSDSQDQIPKIATFAYVGLTRCSFQATYNSLHDPLYTRPFKVSWNFSLRFIPISSIRQPYTMYL